jgi:hypothetical protein
MKVFISSLISGFEEFRTAARQAVHQLGHEPVMAEDFSAVPTSSQVACLTGLRQSALVVLLLGERYGWVQQSGLSATHEEYRDAKGTRPVIAFVQEGVTPEPQQDVFLKEVQGWEKGLFRGGFTTPDQLKERITRAIHEWQVSNAAGPLDEHELLQRALAQISAERGNRYRANTLLQMSLAFGPHQSILRPAEIERAELIDELKLMALFGAHRVFDSSKGTQHSLEDDSLLLTYGEDEGSVRIAPTGDMLFRTSLPGHDHMPIVIEEEVQQVIARTLAFANAVIERIDPTQRLTHFAPVVGFGSTDGLTWRTAAEHRASPGSYSMGGFGRNDRGPVQLTPPVKPRAALSLDSGHMVEDLSVLLRRMWRER